MAKTLMYTIAVRFCCTSELRERNGEEKNCKCPCRKSNSVVKCL